MKRAEPIAPEADCKGCPSVVAGAGPVLGTVALVAIQSQLTVQATDGAWNAVVTTARKGTFLIRRLAGSSIEACPLRTYEIRHIAAVPPPGGERTGGDGRLGERRTESCPFRDG
jgi:hypothetical protein